MTTTYGAEEFEAVLTERGLLHRHVRLATRLRLGFPLGDMRPLEETFTPDNHKAGVDHLDFIQDYVREQVALGHMTGPYTQRQVHEILGSHFRTSPLAVTEKPNSKSGWRLIQNCSYKDRHGVSVNSMIDADDFPTKWGTAAQVAEVQGRPGREEPGAMMRTAVGVPSGGASLDGGGSSDMPKGTGRFSLAVRAGCLRQAVSGLLAVSGTLSWASRLGLFSRFGHAVLGQAVSGCLAVSGTLLGKAVSGSLAVSGTPSWAKPSRARRSGNRSGTSFRARHFGHVARAHRLRWRPDN